MKRLLALALLVAGVGYFVVKEFPQDKTRDEGRLDRMVDTMEKSEFWP